MELGRGAAVIAARWSAWSTSASSVAAGERPYRAHTIEPYPGQLATTALSWAGTPVRPRRFPGLRPSQCPRPGPARSHRHPARSHARGTVLQDRRSRATSPGDPGGREARSRSLRSWWVRTPRERSRAGPSGPATARSRSARYAGNPRTGVRPCMVTAGAAVRAPASQ